MGCRMERNTMLIFTKILLTVFLIGTIISFFIVYMDFDSIIAYKFVAIYAFLAFFLLLYIPLVTIINSRKFKWKDIRKRLFRFIILFIILTFISYGVDYIRQPIEARLFQILPQNLGWAFVSSFFDIIFLKDRNIKSR